MQLKSEKPRNQSLNSGFHLLKMHLYRHQNAEAGAVFKVCSSNSYYLRSMKQGLLFIFLLILFGCNDGNRKLVENAPLISQSYMDDTGRQIQLPRAPEKIISIAPNITEMIFAIGGGDKLVGRSQACDYPAEALDIPEIITYPQLDLEQLKVSGGELIITTDEIFTEDAVARLAKLNLPIYLQSYHTLADVNRCIRDLGTLLGREGQADALADSLEILEQRIVAETENQIKYKTMILVSNDPLKVVGGAGFLNEIIQKSGGKNVFEATEEEYPTMTVEAILAAQPEYIIIPAKDEQLYGELLSQYPMLTNTPADFNKQVFIVDPDLFYRPGPRMVQGLMELTHILHNQLNPQQFLNAD